MKYFIKYSYIIFIFKILQIKSFFNFKRNLILGAIQNYNWDTIKCFFNSLDNANIKKCDIVMFVYNLNESVINEMKSYGIIIQEIPEEFWNMRINNYRYKLYADFLSDKLNKYKMILSIDVRDSIFQKDIFKYYDKYKNFLGVALEDGILTDPVNQRWMIEHYGRDILNSIKDNPIICSGTILATSKIFYNISRTIWEEINSTKIPIPFNSRHDQTILNYIIYHLKIFKDYIIESNNKDGPIMTLDLFLRKKKFSLDSENNILNEKGEIAYITHQYDRSLKLTKIISNKYNERIKKPKEKNNNIYNFLFFIISLIIFLIICFILKIRKNKKKNTKKKKENKREYIIKRKRKIFKGFFKTKKKRYNDSEANPFKNNLY